jgi:hypothetical protein
MLEIANLEVDAKIGKDRHFAAADRKERLRKWLGICSVVGAALLSSKALVDLLGAVQLPHVAPLLLSFISVGVTVTTAMLGFFGLDKQIGQHRMVGNAYVSVARKTRDLLHRLQSSDTRRDDGRLELSRLLESYLEVNKLGEACHTEKRDSDYATTYNQDSKSKIKAAIKQIDEQELGTLNPSASSPNALKQPGERSEPAHQL